MNLLNKIKTAVCSLTIAALMLAIPIPIEAEAATPKFTYIDVATVQEAMFPTKVEPYVDVINGRITEDSLRSICEEIGPKYDISPNLLMAVAWVESSYRIDAVSHCNAQGLCQVMPRWHKDRMVKLGVTDLFDPYSSVLMCADILDNYRDCKYRNDPNWMLMAYNMGPSAALKPYENGHVSDYAKKVMAKCHELGGL